MARRKASVAETKAAARRPGKKTVRAPTVPAAANPVVGIGASAGGLEACTTLLRALPVDLGLVFVVVQHLDPDHESILPRLLSRATSMKVLPIRSGMAVEPDHVYVIPPNRKVVLSRGRLRLTRRDPAGRRMPVDEFFCSLAKDYGRRAIGIVLSGGASDGTLGTRAIKAKGGITFAQDPRSAKCPGMPQSAISAGHVDFVLPPEGIATELARLSRHPYVGLIPPGETPPALADEAILQASTIRALLESASQAILAVDREGGIVLANSMAQQIFQYNREELLRRNIDTLLPERYRDHHSRFRAGYFSHPASRPMGQDRYLTGLRKDGVEVPIEVSLSAVETKAGLLAVAFITDISERIRREELLRGSEAALRASEGQLRRLTAGLLTAQEEERRRVSRELHDDLNQQLAMLAVEIETLERELPDASDALRRRLGSVLTRTVKLSDDVQRTAYQLHPSILEHLGLVSALTSLCADFNSRDILNVRFTHRRVPKSIFPDVSLCLYRITQECLRNVVKHSGNRAARITLTGRNDGLDLIVDDEGIGFDPQTAKKGLGIVSMEERVRLIGGTVAIRSRPGDGARVSVFVPLARIATGGEKS